MERNERQLPRLDRKRPVPEDQAQSPALQPLIQSQDAGRLPGLQTSAHMAAITPPNARNTPILGFDGGQRRSVSTGKRHGTASKDIQLPAKANPPNFRVGMLESDFQSEIITAMDVIEYYSTYGHAANIKLFYLVSDDPSGHPYNLRVRQPHATGISRIPCGHG
jgi:hypothetical protein